MTDDEIIDKVEACSLRVSAVHIEGSGRRKSPTDSIDFQNCKTPWRVSRQALITPGSDRSHANISSSTKVVVEDIARWISALSKNVLTSEFDTKKPNPNKTIASGNF